MFPWFDDVGAWKITVSSADAFTPLRLSMVFGTYPKFLMFEILR